MAEPTALPASLPNADHVLLIVKELGPSVKVHQVATTAQLLKEGATVPFIARYRKEATGELDEVQITTIRDRLEQLAELDKRRESILGSLNERKLLTPELAAKIAGLKTGDKVVTIGGIHGVISNVKDGSTFILKVDDNVKLTVDKSAVTLVLPKDVKEA